MSQMIWSISSLVKYIKNSLDNDQRIQSILIKGEVSNFTNHRSGHLYFTLKDASSRISCVMFASHARNCPLQIKDGMKILATANVSMYEASGNCQLYVTKIQIDGIGDLYLKLEEIKAKMNQEGYFKAEHKQPLVAYPESIGVISAKTGAATQDVFTTLKRRWPLAQVSFYPSLVQGIGAEADLIKTLQYADRQKHDVILIVRGGGSIEDLWCFNSETLAKCVYACQSVIVSGIGHETDTTLIDYVADKRAPTPTAAAELVTPNLIEVKNSLIVFSSRMNQAMNQNLRSHSERFEKLRNHRYFRDPMSYLQNDQMRLMMNIHRLANYQTSLQEERIALNETYRLMSTAGKKIKEAKQQELNTKKEKLVHGMKFFQQQNQNDFSKKIALLDAFSPLKIVQRGYSLAYHDTTLIHSISEVSVGDELKSRVGDGYLYSKIEKKESLK